MVVALFSFAYEIKHAGQGREATLRKRALWCAGGVGEVSAAG